ncbi:4a-hydroxytetrahydrobiopterin dehydratase [Parvibium lacunae]|uniref:4a-hydroxytetrahydrobiopterin dehydratase n=1 Tax=Parvibium lacunae TaxID=1888893 RepID=A0A368L4A6_9BURK|nr:4a-hydroxytetrahydrobiopterin dehydratase [Parvibium lacunae]RCS58404.1 4a-hydroxytetrahydrobiopterin dehydratase [Parvibium lacunae]
MTVPLSRAELLTRTSTHQTSPAYSVAAITEQLETLPGWCYEAGFLQRTYRFTNYYETITFLNALAYVLHREDHHPELLVTYNSCVVRFNTHSVEGISINDFICAAKADAVFGQTYR